MDLKKYNLKMHAIHSLLKVNVSGLFLEKDLLRIDCRKRLPPVSDI